MDVHSEQNLRQLPPSLSQKKEERESEFVHIIYFISSK